MLVRSIVCVCADALAGRSMHMLIAGIYKIQGVGCVLAGRRRSIVCADALAGCARCGDLQDPGCRLRSRWTKKSVQNEDTVTTAVENSTRPERI